MIRNRPLGSIIFELWFTQAIKFGRKVNFLTIFELGKLAAKLVFTYPKNGFWRKGRYTTTLLVANQEPVIGGNKWLSAKVIFFYEN